MQVLILFLQAIQIIIFARVIVSWVVMASPKLRYNPLVQGIYQISEPIFAPMRQIIPPMGGLDLSPLILLFGIQFIMSALRSL